MYELLLLFFILLLLLLFLIIIIPLLTYSKQVAIYKLEVKKKKELLKPIYNSFPLKKRLV